MEPFFTRQPMEVEDEVVAALNAEVIYLCRSGEVDRIYREYPCFNSRSQALEALIAEHRSSAIARRFPNRTITLVTHAHSDVISLVLQVNDERGKPTAAADATIGIRMRDGLSPDGTPLPEAEGNATL